MHGEDFVSLAANLEINRATAYTIIRRYQQHGQVARRPRAEGRAGQYLNTLYLNAFFNLYLITVFKYF